MSRATTEQALVGLIPTLNGPIPPELLDLALSLLARSGSVASSLKSDEEIARPYACAQLACERLKKRLNLPSITSRPPCAPRIYKKLYAYLGSALPAADNTKEPQTPRKSKSTAPASVHNTPKTPASGRKTPRNARDGYTFEEAPDWVIPAIRLLVKSFECPGAAPHIYTGVEVILPLLARMSASAAETPSKRARHASCSRDHISLTRILGLVAVVFLYVYARMKDVDVSPEQYREWRVKVVKILSQMPASQGASHEDISQATEMLMPMAQEEGWLGMEWFLNVLPENDNVGEAMEGIEMSDKSRSAVGKDGQGKKYRGSDSIGLGTMMQDATDYLSERQREEYKLWKAGIIARIDQIQSI